MTPEQMFSIVAILLLLSIIIPTGWTIYQLWSK